MKPRNCNKPETEVGSETGIEIDYSPKMITVDRKSDKQVGTMLKNIFINFVDIVRMLIRWR